MCPLTIGPVAPLFALFSYSVQIFFASEGHSLPHFFSHRHRRIGSSVGFEQIRLNRVTSEQGPRNAEDMASKTQEFCPFAGGRTFMPDLNGFEVSL